MKSTVQKISGLRVRRISDDFIKGRIGYIQDYLTISGQVLAVVVYEDKEGIKRMGAWDFKNFVVE